MKDGVERTGMRGGGRGLEYRVKRSVDCRGVDFIFAALHCALLKWNEGLK